MRPTTPPEAALAEARAAGYEPDETYSGQVKKPWSVHCVECGAARRVTLSGIREGRRCRHSPPLTDQVAVERLKAAGWEPAEPYPGLATKPWKITCVLCGTPVSRALKTVHCSVCRCRRRAERAARAEAELRAAGYEPREPYPGNAKAPWYSICLTCERPRRTSLDTIRAGLVCKHRGIESHPPGDRAS